MELRGHDDESDGEDFLPQHRRLGIGRLFQEGELGSIAPSPAGSAALSSLNYNHSGVLASGSAFRRPPIFSSPLSSSTLSPSAAVAPQPLRQSPQPPHHQQQHGGVGRRSPTDAGGNNLHSPPPVQLLSSLDPKLSLVGNPLPHEQQEGETPKEQLDAPSSKPLSAAATAAILLETSVRSPSNSKVETAAALTATKTKISNVVSSNSGTFSRYRECLKNHAARVGGHVLDGCCEFMPGGEEGSADALKCAACTCHRSFHRKDVEGGEEAEGLFLPVPFASPPHAALQSNPRRYYLSEVSGNGGYPAGSGPRNLHSPSPLSLQTPTTHSRHQKHTAAAMLPSGAGGGVFPPAPTTGFGGSGVGNDEGENNYSGGTTNTESSSEEMQARMPSAGGTPTHPHGMATPVGAGVPQLQQYPQGAGASGSSKKRYRTKFTPEQKEMMAEFAERVGWRMQKQDEAALEQFCRDAGVSRQVFKVWMHNNKHVLLKSKQQLPAADALSHGEQQQPQPRERMQQSSSSS